MKMAKLLFSLFVSFSLATLPMEYNRQEDEKQEQKEPTQEQNVPSLVDLSLNAVSDKILLPVCKQTTAENLATTKQEIQENLTQLPAELQDAVKKIFTQTHQWQTKPIAETKKFSDLCKIPSVDNGEFLSNLVINNIGFAAQFANKVIYLFNAHSKTIEPLKTEFQIKSIALAPNKAILACALRNKTIQLWDLNKKSCFKIIDAQQYNPAHDVVLSPDACYLAARTDEDEIQLWDLNKNKQLDFVVSNSNGAIKPLQFTPHSNHLITISDYPYGFQIWNLEKKEVHYSMPASFHLFQCSPTGKHIAFDHREGITVVDLNTMFDTDYKFGNNSYYPIQAFNFSPDGKQLIVANETISIIDIKSKKIIKEIPSIEIKNNDSELVYYYRHNYIGFLNKHYFFTVASRHSPFDNKTHKTLHLEQVMIYIWDIKTGANVHTISTTLRACSKVLLLLPNTIILNEDDNRLAFFSYLLDTLNILPLEYALKDAESKDDDDSRTKAQQLRDQIEKHYSDQSVKSDKSEEE